MCTKLISAALAFCLLFITVSDSEAMSLLRTAELRCQCIKVQSAFIHPRLIQNVELIPSGPHCTNVEVIIALKSGELVCVDPKAPWVEKIIKRILERYVECF
ncbi:hypothetical protein FKM82_000970 [Ascaphus truei]